MNVIFAHDHFFLKNNKNMYSNGSFSSEVLQRYTINETTVTVISRQKVVSNAINLTLSTTKGVNFVEVPNVRSISTLYKVRDANKIIEDQIKKCDCLIARLPSTIGKMAIKYAIKHNKPYLIEVVGCAWDSNINHGSLVGKISAPYEFFSNRFFINRSCYTIYITKEFLQSRYPSRGKSSVCPNVNIDPVSSAVLKNRISKIEHNNTKIRIGLIGSLNVKYKGHETLLRAVSLLKENDIDIEVEFLGKGSSENWLEMIEKYHLTNKINFIGSLPSGEAVYTWLDSLDLQIQPSLAEAQGRSIIEGMSRGCPIIASKVGGVIELIDNDWLIKPGDYQDLANKIEKISKDKSLMIEQANRNFHEAQQYYKESIDKKREKFISDFYYDVSKKGDKV